MSTPSARPLVEVCNLHRRFGPVQAVDNLTFTIEAGQVVGFIGANGAGKTTTMRMLATLELPDSGEIRIGGYDTLNYPEKVRRMIGWMPDSYGTYENMTVLEYLDFQARAFGFKGEDRINRVQEVMEFTDLTPLADRLMNKLSKGMAQRLCLGRTLLHDPALFLMDEPAAGLDPKARVEFKRLVRLLASEGKTLFISSHILSELDEMCDTLLFIDQGKLIHHGASDTLLTTRSEAIVELRTTSTGRDALLRWIPINAGVALVEETRHGARIRLDDDSPEALAALVRKLVLDDIPLTEVRREEQRLEEAFVKMLTPQAAAAVQP